MNLVYCGDEPDPDPNPNPKPKPKPYPKVDYIVEMKIDIATELTSMGWEFAALTGDFKEYPTHQEGFEKFAHMTEVLLGKLPAETLPYDYIAPEEPDPKAAAPKAK